MKSCDIKACLTVRLEEEERGQTAKRKKEKARRRRKKLMRGCCTYTEERREEPRERMSERRRKSSRSSERRDKIKVSECRMRWTLLAPLVLRMKRRRRRDKVELKYSVHRVCLWSKWVFLRFSSYDMSYLMANWSVPSFSHLHTFVSVNI